jgi:aspartyl-tRNA(Asn)/glutamyl-tRNA(Gln) amidotransferase subunit C
MTKFSDDDVQKLARLSRLRLTNDEIKQFQGELSAILDYVEKLNDVDVDGLEPTIQVTGLTNVVRGDELIEYGVSQEDLLKNAPQIQAGQFKVKRMVG